MEIRSLSASSALVFEHCAARFLAESVNRTPSPSGSPAALGTVCHAALQGYVEEGLWALPPQAADMTRLYTEAYEAHFADSSRFDEGLEMCHRWQRRTDWSGRQVLSTELKENFPIKTSAGELPITYIWDRCDDLGGGEYEVVDYKTWFKRVKAGELKEKIQVRVYALAAQIKFPSAKRIWVTLDQLRHDQVSIGFSRDENIATWGYLHRLAERIIASDGAEETLNADCRYCVRKHACETFTRHAAAGGALGLTDPVAAAQRRYELAGAKTAIDVALADLDAVILGHCEQEGVLEYEAGRVKVELTATSRRTVDAGQASRVLGPALTAEFPGGITLRVVDKLLKERPCRLDPHQVVAIKKLITRQYGEAAVKVTQADLVLVP